MELNKVKTTTASTARTKGRMELSYCYTTNCLIYLKKMSSGAFLSLVFALLLEPLGSVTANQNLLVTCKSRQVTSMKDSMTSSWLISHDTGVNTLINCAALCLQDDRCVSFLYSDVAKNCLLFAVVKASQDMTSSATGYRYYDTCRAAGYYGAQCASDADCTLTNTHCFQSQCRCQPGYSFDPSRAMCAASCSSYGDEFEEIPGYFINGNNEESNLDIDTQACLETCRQASTYVCRTTDVRTSPGYACSTASLTKLDVLASDWMSQDVIGWVTLHFQRHCSL